MGGLARLDQQLAAIPADVEPQEIKALIEADDARLVFVEGQAPGRQPVGQPRLDCKRLVPCMALGDQVVGVPDQDRGARRRHTGIAADLLVADPGSLFHPV